MTKKKKSIYKIAGTGSWKAKKLYRAYVSDASVAAPSSKHAFRNKRSGDVAKYNAILRILEMRSSNEHKAKMILNLFTGPEKHQPRISESDDHGIVKVVIGHLGAEGSGPKPK